jgi:predicted small metal-binding protein
MKMASFKCADLGMKCGFEVKDEDKAELLKIIALHGKETHNMTETSPDMAEKIKKAIKP